MSFLPACAARQTAPDPAWEAAFTRTSSWNGGDIAHSIDLGDHRTLWLFGDSIFGPVIDGKRDGGRSKMLRAGAAWHDTPRAGSVPTLVQFAGTEPFEGSQAVSWASPSPGLFAAGTWYWLMNDAVRAQSPADRLILFATAIGPAGAKDPGWDFRRVGGSIIEIDNPGESPDRWHGVQRINPLVTPDPKVGEPPHVRDNHALAIVKDEDGRGYSLFGVRTCADGSKSAILAHAAAADIARPEAWTFYDGKSWSNQPSDAAILWPNAQDEFTVEPIRKSGRRVLVLIQTEAFGSRRIIARTALQPEGPWSAPVAVYEAPDYGPGAFIYAAKGHAALSAPGELLVSYAVNADLGRVFNDASLYRPKFVRVPLERLPEPPSPGM